MTGTRMEDTDLRRRGARDPPWCLAAGGRAEVWAWGSFLKGKHSLFQAISPMS